MTGEPSHIFVVFSGPEKGQESAYNEWYDQVHLADVTAVPGFVGARRFELASEPGSAESPQYLAIYEIAGDAAAALEELSRRAGTPAMEISPALDRSRIETSLWQAR